MIGHGTNGADGIAEGIHLRWSFDDRLGFPDCFKLYRRKTALNSHYIFPLHEIETSTIDLPYSIQLHKTPLFSFTLVSLLTYRIEQSEVEVKTSNKPSGASFQFLSFNGDLTIRFSDAVDRITFKFNLTPIANFTINILSEVGKYEPYIIESGEDVLQYISFDTSVATGVRLMGDDIQLVGLEVWIIRPGDDWERINDYCGCGLPVDTKATSYMQDIYQGMGDDLAMALCRLGARNVQDSPITAVQFLELKGMLLTMREEGIETPVGWTLFPDERAEDESSLEMSKYDFLLTQSLQVYFAKILGLFWTDTTVNNTDYYDYKITATWPAENKRRLDHELLFDNYDIGQAFTPISSLDENIVMVAPKTSNIVVALYDLFRIGKGLGFELDTLPVILCFSKTVTEVQIVLINTGFTTGATLRVEAYKNLFSVPVDNEELLTQRGMLRLRAENIDSIRIFGSSFTICRIHYDSSAYPRGLQGYIIGGIKKHSNIPTPVPLELTATCLPGGTLKCEDGTICEQPYLAGLRWNANEDINARLLSLTPVLYHIEKQDDNGVTDWLTEKSPLFISPVSGQEVKKDIPPGWPEARQFYTEPIAQNALQNYRLAAMDLFGRPSEWTGWVQCAIIHTAPPPPEQVQAKFLDYNTYDAGTGRFNDPTLDTTDQDWLRNHGSNAIMVQWQWPENLQLQAPGTEGFRIHYKQGWLNNYTGIILTEAEETTLTKTSLQLTQKELNKFALLQQSPENIPAYRFRISIDVFAAPPPEPAPQFRIAKREFLPEDAFRLCWLTQGDHQFLVLKNGTAQEPFIWVLKLNDTPITHKGFGIAVTAGKTFFIDYKDAGNWNDTNVFHEEPKHLAAAYRVYIENPKFPDPVIQAQDISKVRYAQIGVSAYTKDLEGAVSAPASIMAVYRQQPDAPVSFMPDEGNAITGLKATRANVYGKSTFALRWPKSNMPVTYNVFRTLDETLLKTNNENLLTRTEQLYNDFSGAYSVFDPADINIIKAIPYEANHMKLNTHYDTLTPAQWQILASLADNEKAFTRINDNPISGNDSIYADRITDIPDPVGGSAYTPDPANTLLYMDATLNGQSTNRFFYGLRTVDTNGMQSSLSLCTPPVTVPVSVPPPAPVITSVTGGENSITIKWTKNPGAIIDGYLLYRTAEKIKANDYRKMEPIKTNISDVYSVPVTGPLPALGFEFTDSAVTSLQSYYYAVMAIQLDEHNQWLRSQLSNVVTGKAYDQRVPEPPVWDEENSGWVHVDKAGLVYEWDADLTTAHEPLPAIRLVWEDDARISHIIIARKNISGGFAVIAGSKIPGIPGLAGKRLFIDMQVSMMAGYTYSGRSISMSQIQSPEEAIINIPSRLPSN